MNVSFDKIHLDSSSAKPIYQQIAEQLQFLIITGQIKVGEHLPSVRQLGNVLHINPNTVARAYLDLEHQQMVIAKRGGGTIVVSGTDDPVIRTARRNNLFKSLNDYIIKGLSQGYIPEEIEAAFYTVMERWREERRRQSETSSVIPAGPAETIRIIGSNDLALNILVTIHRQRASDIEIKLTSVGSLGGLIALQEEKADLAGTHLLDKETGEYNVPFIKRVLPGREIVLVTLVFRIQGMMVPAGNPKNIKGLEDLRRPEVSFLNRQKGSGTRVLLDMQLKELGIDSNIVNGYDIELENHLAVGSAIAQGKADTGLGIEAAAYACGLDFIPLFRERYDLAIPGHVYRSEKLTLLLEIIKSDEFKSIVSKVEGYDTSQTGAAIFVP